MTIRSDHPIIDLTPDENGVWSYRPTDGKQDGCDFPPLHGSDGAGAEAAESRWKELRQPEAAAHSEAAYWKEAYEASQRQLSETEEELNNLRDAVTAESGWKELRRSEAAARSEAAYWKEAFEASQRQQSETEEELNNLRDAVKEVPSLRADVSYLRQLLVQATGPREDGGAGLGEEIVRLHEESCLLSRALSTVVDEAGRRIEALEAEIAKLRSTGAVLSKRLYGRKSEQQKKPRSGRKRGQQRSAPGHGRTPRPELEERVEELNPPPEACLCARCGQPYAQNGVEESTLIEIEVAAYKRKIRRPRFRRTCECASVPMEVSAPPAPRLFRGTLFGISVWARILFELFFCLRPLHRVAAWMSAQSLAIAPGTLADSLKRFMPLFQPLFEAILAHQNEAVVRHADETSWRVQELSGEDRSNRAWLWASLSDDSVCFHIDPRRSAEAALHLFGDAASGTIIVCDRYSAYKRLARLLLGMVTLAFCWAHLRRDYIDAAAGQERLAPWCEGWLERIAQIYQLNRARLEHYRPDRKRQTAKFTKGTRELKKALDCLFEAAKTELAALPKEAREAKPLRSLLNHRQGLCVFVDKPRVPMDNNLIEGHLRPEAIIRYLTHGSDSKDGAAFTAMLYSIFGTLSMNRIDVLRWTQAWLGACAENGRQPPDDLSPWLPWSMSEERLLLFTVPP